MCRSGMRLSPRYQVPSAATDYARPENDILCRQVDATAQRRTKAAGDPRRQSPTAPRRMPYSASSSSSASCDLTDDSVFAAIMPDAAAAGTPMPGAHESPHLHPRAVSGLHARCTPLARARSTQRAFADLLDTAPCPAARSILSHLLLSSSHQRPALAQEQLPMRASCRIVPMLAPSAPARSCATPAARTACGRARARRACTGP